MNTPQSAIMTMRYWARTGYAARGIVYLMIGFLALGAALGLGGEKTDSKGALLALLQQPLGEGIVVVMICGLLGYSVWRVLQSALDTDDHGYSFKGVVIRGGLFISAVSHFSLAFWATRLLIWGGSDDSAKSGLLEGTTGQIVFALVGAGFIAAGGAQAFKGIAGKFKARLEIPEQHEGWISFFCQYGLIARGIVWGIIGWFFIKASLSAQQGKVQGIQQALTALEQTQYGFYLFAIAAAGLLSFGIYSLIEAVCRDVTIK